MSGQNTGTKRMMRNIWERPCGPDEEHVGVWTAGCGRFYDALRCGREGIRRAYCDACADKVCADCGIAIEPPSLHPAATRAERKRAKTYGLAMYCEDCYKKHVAARGNPTRHRNRKYRNVVLNRKAGNPLTRKTKDNREETGQRQHPQVIDRLTDEHTEVARRKAMLPLTPEEEQQDLDDLYAEYEARKAQRKNDQW